jgi:MoaA/NifB/PqqE/SkfB family radical SAM enzyme
MSERVSGRAYFLPADWIISYQAGFLEASKLSTGESLTVEGAAADALITGVAPASTWSALAKHEPLLGELHNQLDTQELAVLNRASLLRGAGWRQLFVELTARCNERCIHCYAESSPERNEALGLDEIRAVLDDARALGFELVQLTGGDPLISPHCVEAAEYARDIGIPRIEVYTNGLALRGRTYERLRELGVAFAFSFYSRDPARHDAITRTPGSHRRTSRAIQRAVQDGLTVRTAMVTMDENAGEAEETRDYLLQLGVKANAVGVDVARAVGRGDEVQATHHAIPAWAVERKHATGDELGQGAGSRPFGGTAAVAPDGTVYPCIFSRHLPLGSIHRDTLRAILTAPIPITTATEHLFAERAAWATRLSCWECQTRSHMLGARLHD